MKKGSCGLLALAAFIWNAPQAEAEWHYKTDQAGADQHKTSYASHMFGQGGRDYTVVIRCQGRTLDAYVDFNENLGSDLRPVRFKVDQEAGVSEHWWPSKSGTAVFAETPSEFARALLRGSQAVLEVVDERGVRHKVTIALSGSARAIRPVLQDCGVTQRARHLQIEGVRRDVALDIEGWGPKQTQAFKGALKELGFYAEAEDAEKTDELFLAMSRFFDSYLARCEAGEDMGISCEDMRLVAKGGLDPSPPQPSRALTEVAPAPYRHQLITLKPGQ